ncbi:CLUMA_CG003434, isoform A [Clunio marinus]|uniref:CLUMA_CG003434, isoform A n=1 Tax=Clunio marinus TaxID=568069 RepID=A0A1J1HPB5_9DIPT|nr:CLUMA_CG003434, isoform A [Clunio marinus]
MNEEKTTTHSEDEFISKPQVKSTSLIDENIISFDHSFGYDCKKMYNLVLMDKEALVFASGNLIHFFNVSTSKVTTRRSAMGEGIGFIVKNPNPDLNHLTIGENGKNPTIFIYKFPEMKLISMLEKGAKRQFSVLDYTPNGELLASQGGDPDYMLTIWDWRRKEIKLRAKSFSNDVVNLMFSPYISEQLITSGLGHIKFWKMASTFTGLKLQGLIGRFGKTEICDIYGICPMPDEKILSGCEWGNILVWDAGLIKLEVCRKNRKPCHKGPITQIFMRNAEEIMTVGTDGFICIWFWETVELADPPEDDRFVEIEPSHEFRVGENDYNAELLKIIQIEPEMPEYYAQDGLGGIWKCEVSTETLPNPPKQLFHCHAGEIVAMCTSSVSQHVATLGKDGRLYVYDYIKHKMIYHHQFVAAGCDFVWLSSSMDPTGAVMIFGFDDGVVRVIAFDYNIEADDRMQLVQVIKCHSRAITKVAVNPKGSIFVSASEDSTIFIHQLMKDSPIISLEPVGFMKTPSAVTCINWNPNEGSTIILGCKHGEVTQIDLPESSNASTSTSYHLDQVPVKTFKFKSVKSQILRNKRMKEIELEKMKKREKKVKELEKMKKDDPLMEINEEEFLADSDDEETFQPLHIPDPPNSILWIQYTSNDTLWLSLSGFDAGYIYEYDPIKGNLMMCVPIPEAENIEIHSYIHVDNFTVFGMGDGKIRINLIKDDWRDLSDFWLLSMHDNFLGRIPALKFSYDRKFLFSIGVDGNLFSYKWNLPVKQFKAKIPTAVQKLMKAVDDIDDPNFLTLEQKKEKENDEKRQEVSNDNKMKVLKMIEELRVEFDEIMQTNSLMPTSQKLTTKDLHLDDRISNDFQQKLDILMDVVRRKKEFDYEKVKLAGKKLLEYFIDSIDFPIQVIGINNRKSVHSFRIKKLGKDFYHLRDGVELKLREAAKNKRMVDLNDTSIRTVESESTAPIVESFLIGLSAVDIETKLECQMRRLLNKYRQRKSREIARKKEWQIINAERPNPEQDHPADQKFIEEARKTIGNYKLKTDPNFEANENERETIVKKLQEVLQAREDIFNIRNDYNQKIFKLRNKKKNLIEFIERKLRKLKEIQMEMPVKDCLKPQFSVSFDFDREFPERNLDLKKYLLPKNHKLDLGSTTGSHFDLMNSREKAERQLMAILRDSPSDSEDLTFSSKLTSNNLERLKSSDKKSSQWEDEMKNLRSRRHFFEQQQIIEKIKLKVFEFDHEIEELSNERYDVEVKAKFKELFLLTLNNELMILKDFETTENVLIEIVDNKNAERKYLMNRIMQAQSEIEMIKQHFEELKESKKRVDQKFRLKCLDNSFAFFFKKIYKKKLHENCDNDCWVEGKSSGSEKSESLKGSQLDVSLSLENLSEDKCPKNCDQNLYDLVFQLRHERDSLEDAIITKKNEIESIQADLDMTTQRQKKAEDDYERNRTKLVELRQRKQQQLNDVDTVIVLKMDQLQYFKNEKEFADIESTLLFNNQNLTKLYARVGKLALETIEAKRKHRINVIHLAKMKTDIKFMEKQITDLKDETSQAMLKKFGRIVDLNEVEETILRKFAFDMQVEMRANSEDIKRHYSNKINELKKSKMNKEENLNRVIQEATEKLNILTVLEEEKNFLHRILMNQARKKEVQSYHEDENDLSKLKEISNHQKEQIEMLQREIRALSLKSKSFVNIRQKFDPLTYSVTQLRRDSRFEDSICSNPDESILSSTRATSPDQEALNDILKSVKKFVEENLADQLEEVEVENVSLNLSKYLTNVALTFPSVELDETLPEIIKNFSNFIPNSVHVSPENIAKLVAKIVGNFNEPNNLSQSEVMKAIINSTIETASQSAIASDSYLPFILTNIFQQMIITMRIDDISSPECTTEIIERLSKLKAIHARNVNVDEMVNEIVNFANENLEDEIDEKLLQRIILSIINKINS